jgi:hypothetical protein
MKNKKEKTVNEHLMHVYKNTTPLERLMWLKRMRDFWIKMETKRIAKRRITSR